MTQKTKSWAAGLISRSGENQIAFALILITAVLLRVPNLGESLWFDEVLFILPTGKADLAYYVKKQASLGHPPVEDYNPAKLVHMFKTGKLREIFLIHNRYWDGNFDAVYRHLNSIPRLEKVKTRSFKGVDIYTFVPK